MENQDLLLERFICSRNLTAKICDGLFPEDLAVQSMEDVSPAKWHLAHTTWFYETFILKVYEPDFQPFHELYHHLFNSYYKSVGEHWNRCIRGVLSRPTANEIQLYRDDIDARVIKLFTSNLSLDQKLKIGKLVELGVNHEQQHQELMLMDLKHVLGTNPLYPVWMEGEFPTSKKIEEQFVLISGGVKEIGENYGDEYIFDNEVPRHKVYVEDFELSNKLVTNGEFLDFIKDGGYKKPELWLSDGWDLSMKNPLYWKEDKNTLGSFLESTPYGLRELDLDAPVCHISYFEADAYATWRECRLPSEKEWELAAQSLELEGQFYDQGDLMPKAGHVTGEFNDMFGVLWQWTSSHYESYPGYHKPEGALGEYNAKFTNAQRVLRGGSFATLREHFRKTYRNFYQSEKQWPFTGIRLARNKV
ncbi:hypothetical protein A9Q84_00435 [Halobacteriovorax marinus]|uniref:Ergothioneine biosynthesis protein EgtB n=1 Tax=Halobacteriovorax marinus TaxID=97084 RepID=A0A1Y5FBX7_9BACT|nr:hypothetical protein A9Q84_00435 [Halobacteriovorax marinus]